MTTAIEVGGTYTQITQTGRVIRRVRVLAVDGNAVMVQVLFGRDTGTIYTVHALSLAAL